MKHDADHGYSSTPPRVGSLAAARAKLDLDTNGLGSHRSKLAALLLVVAASFLGVVLLTGPDAVAETLTPIPQVSTSANTGEKPQSKVWFNAGSWWAVFSSNSVSPSGSWLWRLEPDNTWKNVLHLSSDLAARADTKPVGNVTHILLYSTVPRLVSVEYVPSGNTYQLWPVRPTATALSLPLDSETAAIDIDSTGRMWLATDSSTTVPVYYSDPPYSSFAGPIALANNITIDDISDVATLPNGTVGVLWSNQNTERFGFKVHVDGDPPGNWSGDEVPASRSAQNVGFGMADDHISLAVASDSTLYAAVKTSYNTSGYPRVSLLV
ncbi:MAG TPA: hypothetical protein VF879_00245, partial [Nitrospirales bacterium]